MVRVSGFLDQGVDVERERRRRLPTPTNNRVRDNNYSAGNSNFHQQQQPIRSHEETSAVINHSKFTRDEQQYSGRGETFSNNLQKSSQVRNQERLRPTILSITPRIVKQESIEMEPLLSNSVSQPSILPLSSRKDGNRIANTMRTDITMGAQVKNHRNLHSSNPTTHRESQLAQPLRYNYVLRHCMLWWLLSAWGNKEHLHYSHLGCICLLHNEPLLSSNVNLSTQRRRD